MREHTCTRAPVYPSSNWLIIHSFAHSLVRQSHGWRRGVGESELLDAQSVLCCGAGVLSVGQAPWAPSAAVSSCPDLGRVASGGSVSAGD